jgi:hypothetical protein
MKGFLRFLLVIHSVCFIYRDDWALSCYVVFWNIVMHQDRRGFRVREAITDQNIHINE